MKFSFLPKEAKFFDLFERATENALMAARQLKELMDTYDNVQERVRLITEREHEGDFITHYIMDQLNTTFITPFDREDIHHLASAMDDVVDNIERAADATQVYRVMEPTAEARMLADTILRSTEVLHMAMQLLRDRPNMKRILEHCIEINRLENEADRVHRGALVSLFANPRDAVDVLRWWDIYETLESTTDRCEDVADVLQAMVLKHS